MFGVHGAPHTDSTTHSRVVLFQVLKATHGWQLWKFKEVYMWVSEMTVSTSRSPGRDVAGCDRRHSACVLTCPSAAEGPQATSFTSLSLFPCPQNGADRSGLWATSCPKARGSSASLTGCQYSLGQWKQEVWAQARRPGLGDRHWHVGASWDHQPSDIHTHGKASGRTQSRPQLPSPRRNKDVSMPGVDFCTAPGDHKLEASSIGPSTCTKPTEN